MVYPQFRNEAVLVQVICETRLLPGRVMGQDDRSGRLGDGCSHISAAAVRLLRCNMTLRTCEYLAAHELSLQSVAGKRQMKNHDYLKGVKRVFSARRQ
jgi:hypothetical protein